MSKEVVLAVLERAEEDRFLAQLADDPVKALKKIMI